MFGNAMPLYPTWADIGLRLLLTVAAGGLIGFNRQAGGHMAGFRTTMLVGLAACLSMIQANVLLSVQGKMPQSFAEMDVLRFPLGVLTGVGFIGGGAILKRGDLVTGITTAATMWVMTAIGLCFGGGQLLAGCVATALVFVVLGPLKVIDGWIAREEGGRVSVKAPAGDPVPDLRALLGAGVDVRFAGKQRIDAETALFSYELRWKNRHGSGGAHLLAALEGKYRIDDFEIVKTAD